MLLLHSTWGKVLLKFLILFYFSPKLHSNCAPTYFSNSRCRSRTSFGEKLAKEREVQRIQLQPEIDRSIRLPILPILPKLPNIAKSCQHPLNPAKICQSCQNLITYLLPWTNQFFLYFVRVNPEERKERLQKIVPRSHHIMCRPECFCSTNGWIKDEKNYVQDVLFTVIHIKMAFNRTTGRSVNL